MFSARTSQFVIQPISAFSPRRGVDHSAPFSVQVTNECSFICAALHACITWTGANLPLPLLYTVQKLITSLSNPSHFSISFPISQFSWVRSFPASSCSALLFPLRLSFYSFTVQAGIMYIQEAAATGHGAIRSDGSWTADTAV